MKLVEAGEDPSSVVSSGYVDPGDTTGGASTYGNGYGSTGSAPATAQETPIITIRLHRCIGNRRANNGGYVDNGYVDNGYVDNTGGAGGTGGYDNGTMLAVRAVPTVQADTTPAIPIRALRRDGIRCLAGVSLGFSNCASGIGFDRCRFLIGSSTGRLSFGSPVEFSYLCGILVITGCKDGWGSQRHERRTQSRTCRKRTRASGPAQALCAP